MWPTFMTKEESRFGRSCVVGNVMSGNKAWGSVANLDVDAGRASRTGVEVSAGRNTGMARLTKISMLAIACATGCATQGGETVGTRGGTVISDDGRFSVEIRPGALEEDVDITIEEVDCAQMSV